MVISVYKHLNARPICDNTQIVNHKKIDKSPKQEVIEKKSVNGVFGRKLAHVRKMHNLEQLEFAKRLNVSVQTISRYERGVKGISADTLYKICIRLSISADTVLPGKRASANTSALIELIATLDEKYIPILEDIIKSFVKAISLKVT